MSTRRKTAAKGGSKAPKTSSKPRSAGARSGSTPGAPGAPGAISAGATSSAPKAAPGAAAPEPPRAAKPEPAVVSDAPVRVAGAQMRKKELIEKVVERSGVKKKDAKPVVEAMMDILGEAIAEGRELNLQPLGKVKQQRRKETATARVTVAKIRQSKTVSPALDKSKEGVADAAE